MDNLEEYLSHLLPIAVSALGALLLSFVIFWLAKKAVTEQSWLSGNDVKKIRLPSFLIIIISAIYISSRIQYPELSETVTHVFQILFIVLIASFLVRSVGIGREVLLKQYDITSEDNLRARKAYTQVKVFERILVVLIIILAIAFVLMTFENIRQIGTSLLASAGIAGIILGVAAQKLLANLLAGFQIAITQPIRIDDVVIIEGEWGRIEEITLTYVVVKIWDQRRLIVPSTQIIEKPFQNWTKTSSDLLGTVFLYTDYRVPIEELREELKRILDNSPLWDRRVHNVQVTNLTDKAVEVRAMVSAKDSPTAWDLRVHVREKLLEFLRENYPESLPRLRVDTRDKS